MIKHAAVLACLVLTACASGPPDRGPPGGGRGPGGPGRGGPPGGGPGGFDGPREQLFISPAGEPFRSPPGQLYPLALWWGRIDPAGAGSIGTAALTTDFERFFAVADIDHDGAIRSPEVVVYETRTVPEILQGAGRGALQGAAPYGLLNDPQPVRSADFNLDGAVTLAEYQRKAREVFIRLDQDKDGKLTRAELPKPMMADPNVRRGGPGGPGRGGPGRGRGGPPGGGQRPPR